jgi:hypothetical protein
MSVNIGECRLISAISYYLYFKSGDYFPAFFAAVASWMALKMFCQMM